MRVDDIITCAPRQREKPRLHWFLNDSSISDVLYDLK